MIQSAKLVKVGSMVRVDLDRVIDRIPKNLTKLLKSDPSGIVLGYKMTDGLGIGLVLELKDGSATWFFNEEIEPPTDDQLDQVPILVTDNGFKADLIDLDIKIKGVGSTFSKDVGLSISSDIQYLINPINFFKWLFYSLKDVL